MLRDDLFKALCEIPAIDVHSHLARERMAARGTGDLLFYHMLLYPMRAAGCPEATLWTGEHLHGNELPYDEWLRYWPRIERTGFGWMLKMILRDLYDFDEPLSAASLPQLEQTVAQRTAQADWPARVLAKGRIVRILSSATRTELAGDADDGLRCTVEQAPTGGTHEAVSWGQRLAHLSEQFGRDVVTLDDLRDAVAAFYDRIDWTGKRALVAWISSEADFRPVADETIDALLAEARRGRALTPDGVRLVEAACIRAICLAIRDKTDRFQICYGVQFLPPRVKAVRPVCRAAPEFASSMGHLLGEFPDIHFNLLSGFEADEPVWCAMTQAYANVSLAGFWWETFFPSVMHAALARRIDMVPAPKLMAYFSDGYTVDYIYGRLQMMRRVLAGVLAEKIDRGFMSTSLALATARDLLFDAPREVFLPGETIREAAGA